MDNIDTNNSLLPRGPYADDPAAWLVVYNTASADSTAWADYYRQARNIPPVNLCGLNLPADECVTLEQFAALASGIEAYLDDHGLSGQILGLLLGCGVPGYIQGTDSLESIPALLHLPGNIPGTAWNERALSNPGTRPDKAALGPWRLVARIDAADLAGAKALVDRASALMVGGLGDGSDAAIWLDPFTAHGEELAPDVEAMTQWAESLDRMRTRLPLRMSGAADTGQEVQFDAINHDGFFWGWSAAQPTRDFFGMPAGKRVFCFQMCFASATAPTLRAATPGNWVDSALAAGYAAAAGSSRSFSTSALPHVGNFFHALRLGWTLAEAWFLACPVLREGLFLVGDPLLQVAMPQAGWDVFGPLDRLEHLDPENPSVALREDESSIVLGADGAGIARPAEGAQGFYALRHVDGAGRSDSGMRVLPAANVSGRAALPPLAPVWPDGSDWRVDVADGGLRLVVAWDRPLARCRVQTIELLSQSEGESEPAIESIQPIPARRWMEVARAVPTAPTRFRWRLVGPAGAIVETAWSALFEPSAAPVLALCRMEVRL